MISFNFPSDPPWGSDHYASLTDGKWIWVTKVTQPKQQRQDSRPAVSDLKAVLLTSLLSLLSLPQSRTSVTAFSPVAKCVRCLLHSQLWSPILTLLHDKKMEIQTGGILGHELEWRCSHVQTVGSGSLGLPVRRWIAEPLLTPSPLLLLGHTLQGLPILLRAYNHPI